MGATGAFCSERLARNINSFSSKKVEDVLVRADRWSGEFCGDAITLDTKHKAVKNGFIVQW